MGLDEACKDTVLPVAWLMWTLKTIRTRVFLRPMSVSPFLSSMSELRSFKIPAQSILCKWRQKMKSLPKSACQQGKLSRALMIYILSQLIRLWFIQCCSQMKRDFNSGLHQHGPYGGCSHVNRRLTPQPPTEPLHLSASTLGWNSNSIEANGWEHSSHQEYLCYDTQEMVPKILVPDQELAVMISFTKFNLYQTLIKSPPSPLLLFLSPLCLHSSNFFKYLEPLQTVSGFSIAVLLDAAFLKA